MPYADPKKNRQYLKDYDAKRTVARRAAHAANPEPNRAYWRQRARRGLPEPKWDAPEHCECCGAHAGESRRAMNLDHCHETGAFRGWLCSRCNLGIGSLGDNMEGLMKAVKYLRRAALL